MAYLYLFSAIVLEVIGTTLMKLSNGFTVLLPSVGMFLFYGLSFFLLALALKNIEMSIAYATWSAVGLSLIACIGIFCFHENVNALKIFSLIFIVIGVVGLNMSGIKH